MSPCSFNSLPSSCLYHTTYSAAVLRESDTSPEALLYVLVVGMEALLLAVAFYSPLPLLYPVALFTAAAAFA